MNKLLEAAEMVLVTCERRKPNELVSLDSPFGKHVRLLARHVKGEADATLSHRIATDHDHRIIDAVSFAMKGHVGDQNDAERLRMEIENGQSPDKLKTACEIAAAFIRWAQDLKRKAPTP